MGERVAILVVDDDDAIRNLIVRVLRREDYDVSKPRMVEKRS
jgi:DNA-binding response OmpR family regulator